MAACSNQMIAMEFWMPSTALRKFETKLLVDVDRIIESHGLLDQNGQGRRGLGHITRSGVLMLCAAWELYVEELAVEVAELLANRATSPNDLPLPVQRELSKAVKEHKHELKPLELAGAGWEHVYISHVKDIVGSMNTPKVGPINEIYLRLTGWSKPSGSWTRGNDFVNGFVKARGDVAHRGSAAAYVRIGALRDYRRGIVQTVTEHDNAAAEFVRDNSVGNLPWNRRPQP